MNKIKFRKIVFIVIYLRKKNTKNKILYLILKRKLHWNGWEFPKGGVEKNESYIKALKREVNEETGQYPINIKRHNFKGKYKYNKRFKDRNEQGSEFSLYSAELKSEKINIDKREHSSYTWKSFDDALKLLKWNNQKRCLKIVNKFLEKRKD
ncbi:MAG: NUDIX domain-containing protein [Candidatus Pacearchaeota archaeon]